MLIATYANKPLHFIVRSDMFNKPVIGQLLRWLNGIPVFRQSEEKFRIRENTQTFERCRRVLRNGGVILFFGEGMTVHDWKLKPMRSGLTRLIHTAIQDSELLHSLTILPVAVNYSKYQTLLKVIHLEIGTPLEHWQPHHHESYTAWKKRFNMCMFNGIAQLKYQMHADAPTAKTWWEVLLSNSEQVLRHPRQERNFLHKAGSVVASYPFKSTLPPILSKYPFFPLNRKAFVCAAIKTIALTPAAIAGMLINSLPYLGIRCYCQRFLKRSIFYDAVLTVGIALLLPAWWGVITLAGFYRWEFWALALGPLGLLTGYAALRGWMNMTMILNYCMCTPQSCMEIKNVIRLSSSSLHSNEDSAFPLPQ